MSSWRGLAAKRHDMSMISRDDNKRFSRIDSLQSRQKRSFQLQRLVQRSVGIVVMVCVIYPPTYKRKF